MDRPVVFIQSRRVQFSLHHPDVPEPTAVTLTNKHKVLLYLNRHHRITTTDVESILGVAPVTALGYLIELEEEGYIEEVGEHGRSSYYRLTDFQA